MRLLIYTDSRGQHTPKGAPPHDMFATRLAALSDVAAEVYLCPMKWTTTIDFIDLFKNRRAEEFDYIILYTGIVDWSPRPWQSAISDLYANANPANLQNAGLNTREYARKVVNFKKPVFDEVFTEAAMRDHLEGNLGVSYEGQPTNNMYSLDMAERALLPRLSAIPNLIFVNSNRFIPGWEGDYARGRPRNIRITEQYSELFRDALSPDRVIDLLEWRESEIKERTCDNLHLTKAGSDWIYDRLRERMRLSVSPSAPARSSTSVKTASTPRSREPERGSDSILIIGNGPSTTKLAEFGFHNLPPSIDTFGMGAAYRYFSPAGWWPKYYAWCDAKVVHSHKSALKQLIEDPHVSTEAFYFSLPISSHPRFHQVSHCSTGDFCFRKAIELRYRNIYLIGIEGDYVEEIAESRALTDAEYDQLGYGDLLPLFKHLSPDPREAFRLFRDYLRIIDRTPAHNPNYFFEGYQRAGDVFSLPRSGTHRNAWRKSAEFADKHGVNVVNLSETSKIAQFRKASWDQFEQLLSTPAPPTEPFSPYGRPIETPVALSADGRRAALAEAGLSPGDKLATLVIGVRFPAGDETRVRNLLVLLDWIDHFYGDLFDVLLMEQDSVSRIDLIQARLRPYVRHAFAYNPQAFNRGWGYNVAVRHFTEAKVVGLLDTDVLTGANFVQEIIDCHTKYKAASPYTNIYYTDPAEAGQIGLTFGLEHLRTAEHIAKPTTICGGIVIVRRDTFMEVAGFEQYVEFAGEDRALDVTLLNYCGPGELRIAPCTYAHLHHPYHSEPRPRAKELFDHLHSEFGCKHDKSITIMDDIHKMCRHASPTKTAENSAKRRPTFGDLDLYRSGRPLAVNGVYADANFSAAAQQPTPAPSAQAQSEPIFPPAFKTLSTYADKELYQAPEPDAAKLAKLYNAFKGKRCFIVGNGPSLNKHDLSLLKDEYVFAVNSIYYKTAETGFRPTFFVVEDDAVMRENIEQIRAYDAPYKFFPTNYKDLHPAAENTYFFRMNRGFYEKSSPNYCVPRFSTDASKVLYCGQSVTYINLQLAFFLGFTEVYLIGMDFDYVIPPEHGRKGDFIYSTTDDPNHFHKDYFGKGKTWKDPKLERVGMNYRQAKISYEAVGRKIYNATVGGKLEIFERVDYERLLRGSDAPHAIRASTPRLDFSRDRRARVHETIIVADLLKDRKGNQHVMVDVGAHHGMTAQPYYDLGWVCYCFEPDSKNRQKLIDRFGGVARVHIDSRAVGDTPAKGVSFFASEESVGISSLHAFRDTHVETEKVDITTISEVVREHGITRIDFLKVDVEGHDFAVLKGAPWDKIKPHAIECEYEDAKTLPQGHTWRDIAEFLRLKGYTVYVSEWHPIVRYGIRHDWRRVVKYYPGIDIPSESWGNLLAFLEDPGEEKVFAAFEANMLSSDKPKPKANPVSTPAATKVQPRPAVHAPAQPTAPPVAPAYAPPPRPEPPAAPRPFYASFGEWLAKRSPRLFSVLRLSRRAVASVWRRRALTIPAAIILAAPAVVAFWPGFEAERPWLLGASAFLIALAATAYVAMRMYAFALTANAETQRLAREIDVLQTRTPQLEMRVRALETANAALGKSLANVNARATDTRRTLVRRLVSLGKSTSASDDALRDELAALSALVDRNAAALRDDLAALSVAKDRDAALHDELTALSASAEQNAAAREAALRRELAELSASIEQKTAAREAALRDELKELSASIEQNAAAREAALRGELTELSASIEQNAAAREATLRDELESAVRGAQETFDATAKADQQSLANELKSEIEQAKEATLAEAKKDLVRERIVVGRLRKRIASSERQIGALRHPSAPSTLVFFGHHKCASRFFRNEVFAMAAEASGARIRKYEIKDPPFHYSMSDELDLANMDFQDLGVNGRDVVLFSNATQRSLDRLNRATDDWRGVRILRDPRQVLVSNYFHHKGDHPSEKPNGWVWDQLAKDKPILRELPEEEGLLYELDSISKQIIETQVLAPLDDPRILHIKIEDFANDPDRHLKQISEFLGVADIAGLDFNRKNANADSGPWKKHFTSKLREVFKQRYGQALIDLGYAEDLHW